MSNIKYVKKAEAVIRGEGSCYAIANYITKEFSPKLSVAVSTLSGEAPKTLNTTSDRVYYFFEGEAKFIFTDQIVNVEKFSSLFIPANTEYKMIGHFQAILINSPAFNINDERHTD